MIIVLLDNNSYLLITFVILVNALEINKEGNSVL
jgi:hypothetical protein